MSSTTRWHVTIDWTAAESTDNASIAMLEQLEDLRPALSVEGLGDLQARYELTVHLDEATLRQAIATALQRVETTTGHKAEGLEAISLAEVQRRLDAPNVPDLVGHADIAEILGVSRQRAAQLADRDDFPPAVMTIKAGPLRVRDQVEAWATTWSRKGGRPRKSEA